MKEHNMSYLFPEITSIDDIYNAIEFHNNNSTNNNKCEFYSSDKGRMTFFNYNVVYNDTFSGIDNTEEGRYNALLRECRGIVFDNKTGLIVRRPYHKFFNVGEREETFFENIDLTRDHIILEKLDGSMISPYIDENGVIIWGSKMGFTSVAEQVHSFIDDENGRYNDFVQYLESIGKTGIFEWCSRKQRIVIDYPVDALIMTGIRDKNTGNYVSYDDLRDIGDYYNIPVVTAYESTSTDIVELVENTRSLQDKEGFVIRFNDGHMYKIKANEYLTMHRAKDNLTEEKNIIKLIISGSIDDILPVFNENDKKSIIYYRDTVQQNIMDFANTVHEFTTNFYNTNPDRKSFSLSLNEMDISNNKCFYFNMWNGIASNWTITDLYNNIIEAIHMRATSQKNVDSMRNIIGDLSWYDCINMNYDD